MSVVLKFMINNLKIATNIISRFLYVGIAFLVTIKIARDVNLETAGQVFVFMSLVQFLSCFFRQGLDKVVVKQVASLSGRDPKFLIKLYNEILYKVLRVSVTLAVITTLLFCLVIATKSQIEISIVEPSTIALLMVGAYCIFFNSVLTINGHFLQGLNFQHLANFYINGSVNIPFLLGLLLLSCNNVTEFALVYCLANFFAFSISILSVIKKCSFTKCQLVSILFPLKVPQSSAVDRDYKYMWYTSMIGQFVTHVPVILCSLFFGSGNAALLRIAQRVATLINIALNAINAYASVRLAYAFKNKSKQFVRKTFFQYSRLAWVTLLPLLVGLYLFLDEILLAFGSDYKAANEMTKVLLAAQFFNIITSCSGTFMIMKGQYRLVFVCALISVLASIISGILMVDFLLVTSVVLSCAIFTILQNTIFSFYCLKDLNSFNQKVG